MRTKLIIAAALAVLVAAAGATLAFANGEGSADDDAATVHVLGFVDGLPVGLQLVGAPWADARLLRLARVYEQATRYAERAPVIDGDDRDARGAPEAVERVAHGRGVGRAVVDGRADYGVVMCWTGTGTAIAANKVPGVRAALAWDPWIARGAR